MSSRGVWSFFKGILSIFTQIPVFELGFVFIRLARTLGVLAMMGLV
jgi:hypothetical protein